MTGRSPERIFQTGPDLPSLPVAATAGAFVGLVTGGIHSPSRQDVKHLAVDNPVRLDAIRRQPHVSGVVLHPGGVLDPLTGVALAFAQHLSQLRRGSQAPVISTGHGHAPTAGRVGVLHFVTIDDGASRIDAPLWEWATPTEAAGWFGRPLPDTRALYSQLDGLLALRRSLRDDALPDSTAVRALRRVLTGRYFSGRFVLEHHDLVTAALASLDHRMEQRS